MWLFNRDCVRFYAIAGSDVLQCLVSGEALMMHFGATGINERESLRAFNEHRLEIEAVAERKVLSGMFPLGGELILRTDDFAKKSTSATTTTPPPGYRHIISRVSQEIMQDSALLNGVKAANSILDEDLVREGMHVSADWDLVPTEPRLPLARVLLTDRATKAKAERLFTGSDLAKLPAARISILRLWDDLLRERGRKLMQNYVSADSNGN